MFLLFKGNASEKLVHYANLPIAFLFVLLSYFYGLKSHVFKVVYYIYIFILLYSILSILEIKYNLILPSSGKYNNGEYAKAFEGIPTTTFANPNDFSSAMGVYFIYVYSYCKSQKNKFRFIFLPLAFFNILLANSRGILVSILLLPLVYSVYNKKASLKTIFIYLFLTIIFFIFLRFFGISWHYLNKYLSIFSNIRSGSVDHSALYRINIIMYCIANIKSLLIGFGPNGSSVFLKEFPITNPHNFFLEILIDYGAIGLILILFIFYNCFKLNVFISRKNIPEYLRSSCKATNILFCLHIIFSAVSSNFLRYWSISWFPVYLTMMHYGIFNKLKMTKNYEMVGRCYGV
jgi:O-antigen ligase